MALSPADLSDVRGYFFTQTLIQSMLLFWQCHWAFAYVLLSACRQSLFAFHFQAQLNL